MKSASRLSPEDRPWLKEKVYGPKRRRTVELVKRSVDSLVDDRKRISLSALSARSKEIDPDGRGVSETAILNNEEARAHCGHGPLIANGPPLLWNRVCRNASEGILVATAKIDPREITESVAIAVIPRAARIYLLQFK